MKCEPLKTREVKKKIKTELLLGAYPRMSSSVVAKIIMVDDWEEGIVMLFIKVR